MKVAAVLSVLAFVATQAAAAPEADAYKLRNRVNFCGVPGMQCGKVRRDADASPFAMAEAKKKYGLKNRVNFCGVPGMQCGKAKRDADARKKYGLKNRVNFCGVPGMQCGKAKRDAEAFADADAEAKKYRLKNWVNFCGIPGMQCGKARSAPEAEVDAYLSTIPEVLTRTVEVLRRDAEPEADAEAKRRKKYRLKNFVNFCGIPGMQCGRRRDETSADIATAIETADPSTYPAILAMLTSDPEISEALVTEDPSILDLLADEVDDDETDEE